MKKWIMMVLVLSLAVVVLPAAAQDGDTRREELFGGGIVLAVPDSYIFSDELASFGLMAFADSESALTFMIEDILGEAEADMPSSGQSGIVLVQESPDTALEERLDDLLGFSEEDELSREAFTIGGFDALKSTVLTERGFDREIFQYVAVMVDDAELAYAFLMIDYSADTESEAVFDAILESIELDADRSRSALGLPSAEGEIMQNLEDFSLGQRIVRAEGALQFELPANWQANPDDYNFVGISTDFADSPATRSAFTTGRVANLEDGVVGTVEIIDVEFFDENKETRRAYLERVSDAEEFESLTVAGYELLRVVSTSDAFDTEVSFVALAFVWEENLLVGLRLYRVVDDTQSLIALGNAIVESLILDDAALREQVELDPPAMVRERRRSANLPPFVVTSSGKGELGSFESRGLGDVIYNSASWSADSQKLLVHSYGNAWIFDRDDWENPQLLYSSDLYLNSATLSNDGRLVALSVGYQPYDSSQICRLYDAQSGEWLRDFAIEALDARSITARFSADDSSVLCLLEDGRMLIYESATGELVQDFQLELVEGERLQANNLYYDGGERIFVTSNINYTDSYFWVLDGETGAVVQRIGFLDTNIAALLPLGDGRVMVSSSDFIRIYDMESGAVLVDNPSPEWSIGTLQFLDDGTLVGGSFSGLHIIDPASAEFLGQIYSDAGVPSPDGSLILDVSDGLLNIYQAETSGLAFRSLLLNPSTSGLDWNGNLVLADVGRDVYVYDIASNAATRISSPTSASGLGFSPDGSMIALGGYISGGTEGAFLYDTQNLAAPRLRLYEDAEGDFNRLVFSPDSSMVAVADDTFGVMIFDTETGAEVQRITYVANLVRLNSIYFGDDGSFTVVTYVYESGALFTLKRYDIETGEVLAESEAEIDIGLPGLFYHEGRLYVPDYNALLVYEASDFSLIQELEIPFDYAIQTMEFNGDGTAWASTYNTRTYTLDLESGEISDENFFNTQANQMWRLPDGRVATVGGAWLRLWTPE